jgi:hypothetical protein
MTGFTRRVPFALLILFLFAPPSFSSTIRGSVVNGTLSQPQPGCSVSLIAHGKGNNVVSQTTTDEAGAFTLEAPADTTGLMLYISTSYDDVEYGAPFSNTPALKVFEKTTSDSTIRVMSYHLVVDANAREVTQILVYQNTGDRTFATGEGHGHGLEITLPTGVSELLGGDQGMHLHENVLVDPRPAYPGTGQLAFGFAIPSSGDLGQVLPYPVDALDVLVTPPDAAVTATSFKDLGESAFGEKRYRRYNRTDLAKGARIELSLAGAAGAASVGKAMLPWVLSALGLVMAGVAIYFGRKGRETETPRGSQGPDLQGLRQGLLRQLADLDDEYASGAIEDEAYQSRRDALKAEVVRLTQTLSNT